MMNRFKANPMEVNLRFWCAENRPYSPYRNALCRKSATNSASMNAESLHLAMQGGTADAQHLGCQRNIAVDARQRPQKRRTLGIPQELPCIAARLLKHVRGGDACSNPLVIQTQH